MILTNGYKTLTKGIQVVTSAGIGLMEALAALKAAG